MADPRPKPAAQFHAKLLRAQQAARPIAPSGQFPSTAGQRLAGKPYISEQGATEKLKTYLHNEGFTLTYSVVESRDLQLPREGKPPNFLHTARVAFTLTDSATGHSETYFQEGRQLSEDHRGPDHALKNAAHIFIMRLLLVGMAGDDAPPPQGRAGKPQQQRGRASSPGDPGQQADGRERLIPEAQGLRIERQPDGSWLMTNGPTPGLELDQCLKCNRQPRIQVGAGRFLCIDKLCGGVYIDPILADLQERGGPPPPPPPTESRRARNVAEEIRIFRKTVDDMVERVGHYDWQLDAVVQATPELPDNVEKWGLPDWQMFTEALQKDAPNTIKGALAIMAKRTPAGKERIGYLESLFPRLPTSPVEMMKLRLEADAAAKSGWHDAVQQLIEACEKKLNQGELPMGAGQKARAR